MEKTGTILHHDHDKEKKLNDEAEALALKLSKTLESYAALGLKESITIEHLVRINNPEQFIRELIFDGNEVLKVLPIERSHALAMIKVPDGTNQFVEALKAVNAMRNSQHGNPIAKQLYNFEVEEFLVKVKESFYNLSKENSTIRCQSEKQEEIYAVCKEINEKITTLMEKYPDVKFIDKDLNTGAILVQSTIQDPNQNNMYIPHLYFRPINISSIK